MKAAFLLVLSVLASCTNVTPLLITPTSTISMRDCTKNRVEFLIGTFFQAYNSRDKSGVIALFKIDDAQFQYYDNIAGRVADIRDRLTFERYLENRFNQLDEFHVTQINMPEQPAPFKANPTVSYTRRSMEGMFQGNIKFVCVSGYIIGFVTTAERLP
ncbi:MAG: hypothetical protein HY070_10915 [Chloroflexi bacterium]|nr:hypothetical protein [Chloroflexota bacterium]